MTKAGFIKTGGCVGGGVVRVPTDHVRLSRGRFRNQVQLPSMG